MYNFIYLFIYLFIYYFFFCLFFLWGVSTLKVSSTTLEVIFKSSNYNLFTLIYVLKMMDLPHVCLKYATDMSLRSSNNLNSNMHGYNTLTEACLVKLCEFYCKLMACKIMWIYCRRMLTKNVQIVWSDTNVSETLKQYHFLLLSLIICNLCLLILGNGVTFSSEIITLTEQTQNSKYVNRILFLS